MPPPPPHLGRCRGLQIWVVYWWSRPQLMLVRETKDPPELSRVKNVLKIKANTSFREEENLLQPPKCTVILKQECEWRSFYKRVYIYDNYCELFFGGLYVKLPYKKFLNCLPAAYYIQWTILRHNTFFHLERLMSNVTIVINTD